MNSFGRLFRLQIFGESHGPAVGLLIDGCLPGIAVSEDDFRSDIERRRGGQQPGSTSRKESDIPVFLSGVFNGFTTGAPLTIIFQNGDVKSKDYEQQKEIPRPGHADWVAGIKASGFQDYRGGGHYSGRLTVALVAAGVIAKKLLRHVKDRNITCEARILEIGGLPDIADGVAKAMDVNDSVGGIIECKVAGLPPGLGEPFFDSVESLISHAVFSIPAIKGIEFGSGFAAAKMFGSEHNDVLLDDKGNTATNYAGGIVGGLTNGNEIVFRVAVKPTSSTPKEQISFNVKKSEMESFTIEGRHDLCIALRVPPVLEAITAIVLADLLLLSGFIKNPTQNQ